MPQQSGVNADPLTSEKGFFSEVSTDALTLVDHGKSQAIQALAPLVEKARGYARAERAKSTTRRYETAWAGWEAWCRMHGVEPLPTSGEVIGVYAASMAESGAAVASIELAVVAISRKHVAAGHPSPRAHPALRAVMSGIRRTHGVAGKPKAALQVDALRRVLKKIPDTMLGARDRALLLVGFAGAFRRSELVALDLVHVAFDAEGLRITIARSKTDQEGRGRSIGIPLGKHASTCPVRALRAWLERARITEGPIFRGVNRYGRVGERLSSDAVACIVKRAAARVGLDPEVLAGHSLRSGFATSASRGGASEREIMRQTGHTSERMVRRYVRDGQALDAQNPARRLGL